MRKHYLDNIRWFTVVLVALYHVIYIFNGILPGTGLPFKEVQYQDAGMYVVYPWFMLLLFIVSGMSARFYLETHTVQEFKKERTRKLLVPSTIGILVIGWIQGYINMSVGGAFENMTDSVPAPILFLIMALSGTGVLWFVQMLWLFSMLLIVIRRFEKGKLFELTKRANIPVLILLVIPLWISGQILNTPIVLVYRFGIYTFAYLLGYFVFAHEEVITRISNCRYVFIPVAVALGIGYTVLYFGENYAEMPLVGSPLAVGFAWAAILAIFGSAKAWGDKTNAFTLFMTKKSWGIYVFHYLPLSAMAYALRNYTDMAPLPCYLLTAVAAFLGSIVLYEVVSRIPFLRWCVLGMKKEKKDVSR